MNTKGSKRHKHGQKGFKTKTKDGNAEVFVLPPDLLKKLGINLGSVECQESSTELTKYSGNLDLSTASVEEALNAEVPQLASEQSKNKVSQSDSTILETADLMKKSVFLSPTFVTSSNNINSGEIEISNVIEPENTIRYSIDTDDVNSISKQIYNDYPDPVPEKDILPVIVDPQTNTTEINNIKNNCDHKNEKVTLITLESNFSSQVIPNEINQISLCDNVVTDILKSSCISGSADDHSDEAYLSDCSNSNLEPSDIDYISEKKALGFEVPKEFQNKIKILSEEIISSSKLKDLQIMLSPKKTNFIPVSMNCLLRSENLSENSKYNTLLNNNICIPKGDEHNFIVLCDEAGKLISNGSKNNMTLTTPHKNDLNTTDVEKFSLISNQIEDTVTNFESRTPENSFGDIDLTVIDMEIEENEDILEKFVNEITSNDDNIILEKIKQSEKDSSSKSDDILQVNTKRETKNTYFKINNDEIGKDDPVENKRFESHIKFMVFDSNQTEIYSNFFNQLGENTKFSQISHRVKHNKCIGTELKTIQPNISHKISYFIDTMQNKDEFGNIEKSIENLCLPTDLDSMAQNATESLPESENKTESNISTEIFSQIKKYVMPIETKDVQQNITTNTTIGNNISSIDLDLINMKNKATESLSKVSVISETKKDMVHLLKIEDRKIKADLKEMHDDGNYIATDGKVITKEEIGLPKSKNDTNGSVQQASDDKIKEIAMYLSQFAKSKSNSVKMKRKLDENLKISAKRTKSSPLTSKLRIQGVEKPGGSVKSDKDNNRNKVLKTYTRCKKIDKQSFFVSEAVAPMTMTRLPELSYSVDEQESYCDIVVKGARKPEYCLCSDFGRLAYYGSNYPYEHIHFWEHKIDCCDRETVFSIYNSDYNISTDIKEVLDISEEDKQKPDKSVYSICWRSCKKELVGNLNSEIPKIVTQEALLDKNGGEALSIINKENEAICIPESKQVDYSTFDTNSELYHDDLNTNVTATASINLASDTRELIYTCDLQTEGKYTLKEDNNTNNLSDIKSEVNQNQLAPTSIKTSLIPSGEQSEAETDKNKKSKSEDINALDLDDHVLVVESERSKQNMGEKCSTVGSTQEANASQHVGNSNSTKNENAAVKDKTTDVDVPESSTRKHKHEEKDAKELNAKKTFKCDVCNNIVSKSEWDRHVSREHCFIAWKCGSTFDFKKPCLLKKLQEKVKTSSSLKCTFCNAEFINPKKFLKHVKKCYEKLQASFETALETSTNDTTADDTAEDVKQPEENATNQSVVDLSDVNESITSDDNVSKCGVCKEIIPSSEWIIHITDKHDYLAWKDGDTPLNLDDENDVRQHLIYVVREIGQLKCSKCGLSRKYPKTYMQHVQQCTGSKELQTSQEEIDVKLLKTEQLPSDVVKCAVCSKSMSESEWMQHIKEAHEYLAWREGEPPLDTEDEESVRNHLYNISKQNDGIECVKCGCVRKYVKSYLVHIKSCQELTVSDKLIAVIDSTPETKEISDISTPNSMVKCGVCGKEVWSENWIRHISKAHNYMAWKEGESLDVNNSEEVYNHLYNIVKKTGALVCSKCGHIRKYVKSFLQHVSICDVVAPEEEHEDSSGTQENTKELVCALCSEEVSPKKWKNHKMEKHYNVAWTVGGIPVDYKNANVIDILIKEYMARYKRMVCKVCHASRVSRIGFYAHVIACGKTEEEIEVHRTLCDICNKKYLCVYHNQHMAWHTQQELAKVKKLKAQEEEEERSAMASPKREVAIEEEVLVTGQRRAAQKARNMIENFSNEEYAYRCPGCKFGSDSKKALAKHVCGGKDEYFSDSGESMKLENGSGDESDDTIEVDSNVSDEEQSQAEAPKKKKKSSSYYSVQRFPRVTQKLSTFLTKIGVEFHHQHLTTEILYSDLRVFDCEPVPTDQLGAYLPPIEVSCKVRFCESSWKTYKRFESERKKCTHAKSISVVPCHSMFTGGCIQCMSWAPPAPGPETAQASGSLLAVACHSGTDIPRMVVDDIAPHSGLIQIWDFDDFSQAPELAFGLAHDYGTAWAMDWCPSGARDAWPADGPAVEGHVLRLGLLAVAFSTGCVAVFSVPHPSTLVNREQLIQKLKPVAELRMTLNPERKIYQATSVSWSMQKPYDCILVGYGDGSTAYFDLNTESPFLKTIENNLTILYPYHDERTHSTCITGVSLYPCVGGACPAAVSSSRTGAALVSRAGVRPARQHAGLAAGHAHFQPAWPAAALSGDEANFGTSVNEIEWFGGGRRLGGGNAGAGCRHCGRYVLAAAPLIRVRFPHPADNVGRREVLGVLQMAPLGKDRKKLANDELQTIVEPTTYDDAVRKYGVELRIDKESIEKATSKSRESVPERRPERFPLGDVTALAYCPAAAHHRKLAAATHAGMLFLIQT